MSRNPFADETPLFDGAPVADEPIFLQPTTRDRMIENGVGIILGLFVAFTVICSIFMGFSTSSTHLFLGICLLAFSAVTVQLTNWYKIGNLDPNFKIAILTLFCSCALLAIVANVYFWSPPAVNPVCGLSTGKPGVDAAQLYDTVTKTCWLRCGGDQVLDMRGAAPGVCKPAPA